MILRDVTRDHHIHGQAEGGTVQRGHDKNTPRPQRLQDRPQKRGIAADDVLDSVQGQATVRWTKISDLQIDEL